MIPFIKLKNFRSHESSTINLSKYITVVVGQSLAGKTNIARALRWVAFNRPSGDKVHSKFDEDKITSVSIKADNKTITHKRKDKKNSYKITGSNNFARVGTAVPDEVKKALNLDEINIQNQLDQHYLITSTPGQVTKEINKIIGANKADRWIKELTTKINSLNQIRNISKKDLKESRKKLEKYKVIIILDNINKSVKDCQKKIERLQRSNDRINELTTNLSKVNRKIEKFRNLPEVEQLLNQADDLKSEILDLQNENKKLKLYHKTSRDLENKKRIYERMKRTFMKTIKEMGRCPLCTSMISNRALERIYQRS